jgi:uncharacterized protein YkwD
MKSCNRVRPSSILPWFLVAAFLAVGNAVLAPSVGAQEFVVKSDQGETIYPLWVEKGETITFQVSGSWSMWHPQWARTDWKGHSSFEKINGHYLGALMGAIGAEKPFPVDDGLEYTSPVSGRLILYPNRGDYKHLKSTGSVTVAIDGGRRVTAAEAEKQMGWDIPLLDTARDADYMTEAEKDVVLFVNKARHDPPLFAELYLKKRNSQSAAARECYQQMSRMEPQPVLHPSQALWKAARDHAKDMGEWGKTGHVGTDGSNLSLRINRYGKWKSGISENCSYGFDDPLAIVLQLLIDDGVPSRGHRKNILAPKIRLIGASIQPHARYGYNCVQDFAVDMEE